LPEREVGYSLTVYSQANSTLYHPNRRGKTDLNQFCYNLLSFILRR
jgi:hypothetical protein